ncbi:exported hypothetical protein [Candidatus Magnetomoraceae bacterium gMMP-1]
MKKFIQILMSFVMIFMCAGIAAASKPLDFTQDDRDRLVTLEVKVENNTKQIERLETHIQKQFDEVKSQILKLETQMQKQTDKLFTVMMWLIGIVLTGMGIMIGQA